MKDKVIVMGANGALGRAVLQELGPDRAIAATRPGRRALPDFEHITLQPDGQLPQSALARCDAVINAAGLVSGDEAQLKHANIVLPTTIAYAARVAGVRKFVQVGSFSIFGSTELIAAGSSLSAESIYARTKLEADRQLDAIRTDDFAVESLRLPFIFSSEKPGLLSSLISFALRFRAIPVAQHGHLQRSMITYADASKQLVEVASERTSGVSIAADPQLFTVPLFQSVLADELGVRIKILPVPSFAVQAINKMLPAAGRRLFRSSILDPQLNRAGSKPLSLESELRAAVNKKFNG